VSFFEEYARYDALGLAQLVRREEVSPDELLDAALARTAAEMSLPPIIRASSSSRSAPSTRATSVTVRPPLMRLAMR